MSTLNKNFYRKNKQKKSASQFTDLQIFGADNRIRTDDLILTKDVLCLLSYISICAGIDLSSQAASRQVFSALLSLTSVFGMGTGGTSALFTPARCSTHPQNRTMKTSYPLTNPFAWSSPRPISITLLHVSPHFHM